MEEEGFSQGQAPPSYESVMTSDDGGSDLEQRRLYDKMMRGAVRLRSLLDLYKPSKYSPEVCKAKEEQRTEKIERSYLDFQEDLYIYKNYLESVGRPDINYDEAVSDVSESVIQFTVEMSARALSAMSVSSSEDRQQMSGQNWGMTGVMRMITASGSP